MESPAEVVLKDRKCCAHISNYLPVIQTLVLAKWTKWAFKISVRDQVAHRFKEMGISSTSTGQFLSRLKDTGSVISGSFLVAVLVSEPQSLLEWSPNDIDVYSPITVSKGSCAVCGSPCRHTAFTASMVELGAIAKLTKPYPMPGLLAARNWDLSGAVVNEIMLDRGVDLRSFVFGVFDFDFCKATFDGATLAVFDPETVLQRRCVYTGGLHDQSQVGDSHLVVAMLIQAYTSRIEKYRTRGFTIDDLGTHEVQRLARKLTKDRDINLRELTRRLVGLLDLTKQRNWLKGTAKEVEANIARILAE